MDMKIEMTLTPEEVTKAVVALCKEKVHFKEGYKFVRHSPGSSCGNTAVVFETPAVMVPESPETEF